MLVLIFKAITHFPIIQTQEMPWTRQSYPGSANEKERRQRQCWNQLQETGK